MKPIPKKRHRTKFRHEFEALGKPIKDEDKCGKRLVIVFDLDRTIDPAAAESAADLMRSTVVCPRCGPIYKLSKGFFESGRADPQVPLPNLPVRRYPPR